MDLVAGGRYPVGEIEAFVVGPFDAGVKANINQPGRGGFVHVRVELTGCLRIWYNQTAGWGCSSRSPIPGS